MTAEDLEKLAALERSASSAPWNVVHLDDDLCMSAIAIMKNASSGEIRYRHDARWMAKDTVAVCLLQDSERAIVDDGCWDENALLISTVRNILPELLRLAKVGLDVEQTAKSVVPLLPSRS